MGHPFDGPRTAESSSGFDAELFFEWVADAVSGTWRLTDKTNDYIRSIAANRPLLGSPWQSLTHNRSSATKLRCRAPSSFQERI